jgi:ketosteroid isomerase-like protein
VAESDYQKIEERLQKVEKQNRNIKIFVLVLIAIFIVYLIAAKTPRRFVCPAASGPAKCSHSAVSSPNPADQLAIRQLLYSYSHAFNGGDLEGVLAIFADNALMEMNIPGQETVKLEGKSAIRNLFSDRIQQFAKMKIQRRHLMTNFIFVDTAKDRARIELYFLLGSTKDNKLSFVTTGTYEGTLVKQGGNWLIQHWIDNLDKGVDVPVKSK